MAREHCVIGAQESGARRHVLCYSLISASLRPDILLAMPVTTTLVAK